MDVRAGDVFWFQISFFLVCNADYDVGSEFMMNDYRGYAQIEPKRSNQQPRIVAFLQLYVF